VSAQPSSPIRFACPHCGGNVKVPPGQAGQRCRCPRCNAEIIAPGGAAPAPQAPVSPVPPQAPGPAVAAPPRPVTAARDTAPPPSVTPPPSLPVAQPPPGPAVAVVPSAESPERGSAGASLPQPAEDLAPPTPLVGVLLDDEEYGISCGLCGTRLAVRPSQVGQTVTCPDCYSPVLVKPRPKQDKPKPVEYEEAELFKLSDPVERPSPLYLPPGVEGGVAQALGAPGLPAGSATTGNLMKDTARELLAKARAEQEAEEAEQREVSPDRFTGGLFAFLADAQAIGWLAILAVWFEVVISLVHYASSRTMAEGAAQQLLAQFGSLAATVAAALLGLGFLFAAAACAVAIIQDTAHGRSRIENWPGPRFWAWGGNLFCVVSAEFLSFLPGVVVGFILTCAGIPTIHAVLLGGTATFVLLFPPIFLSMLESGSALAPASSEVWASVRERPAPWKLACLLTAVVAMGGLIALAICCYCGCLVGLLGAVGAVACGMTYFRAVGRLAWILSDQPETPPGGEHTAGG